MTSIPYSRFRSSLATHLTAIVVVTAIGLNCGIVSAPAHAATAIDFDVARSLEATVLITYMAGISAEYEAAKSEAVRLGDVDAFMLEYDTTIRFLFASRPDAATGERRKIEEARVLFLRVGRQPVDLEIAELSFPSGVNPGPDQPVRVVVANTGYESVGSYIVKLMSVPNEGGLGEQIGFAHYEANFEPGPIVRTEPQRYENNILIPIAAYAEPALRTFDIPITLEAGKTMRIRAIVEVVSVSNSDGDGEPYDNAKECQIIVPTPAYLPSVAAVPQLSDMEVTDINFPSGVQQGSNRIARVLVRSNGPAAGGAQTVRLYAGTPGSILQLVEERSTVPVPGMTGMPSLGGTTIGTSVEFLVTLSGTMEFRAEVSSDLPDPVAENNAMNVSVAAADSLNTGATTGFGAPTYYIAPGTAGAASTAPPVDLEVMGLALPENCIAGPSVPFRVRVRNNSGSMISDYRMNVAYRRVGTIEWLPFQAAGAAGMTGGAGMLTSFSGPLEAWANRDLIISGSLVAPGDYEFRADVEMNPAMGYAADPVPTNNSGLLTGRLIPQPPPRTDLTLVELASRIEDGQVRVIGVVRNDGPLWLSQAVLRLELLDVGGAVLQSSSIPFSNVPTGGALERAAVFSLNGGIPPRMRATIENADPMDGDLSNNSLTK